MVADDCGDDARHDDVDGGGGDHSGGGIPSISADSVRKADDVHPNIAGVRDGDAGSVSDAAVFVGAHSAEICGGGDHYIFGIALQRDRRAKIVSVRALGKS